MQNLRQLSLFQLYRQLPFITYKSAYLIPQRQPIGKNNSDLTGLKQYDSQKATLKTLSRSTGGIQHELSSSFSLLSISKLHNYIDSHVLPEVPPTKTAIVLELFIKNQQKKLKKILGKKLMAIPRSPVSKEFNKLPLSVKKQYQDRASAILEFQSQAKQLIQKEFKIPTMPFSTPKEMFDKEKKGKNTKYQSLKKKQLKALKKRFEQAESQYKQNLETFLAGFKLTIPQFMVIKDISNRTKQLFELYRQYQKMRKQTDEALTKVIDSIRGDEIEAIQQSSSQEMQKFKLIKQFLKPFSSISQQELSVLQSILSIDLQSVLQSKREKISKIQQTFRQNLSRRSSQSLQSQPNVTTQNSANIEQKENVIAPQVILQGQKITQKTEETPKSLIPPVSPSLQPKKAQQTRKSKENLLEESEDDEKSIQLKDEELNDLQILDDDYEVIRLHKLIEKSKISNKKLKA